MLESRSEPDSIYVFILKATEIESGSERVSSISEFDNLRDVGKRVRSTAGRLREKTLFSFSFKKHFLLFLLLEIEADP